MPPASHSDDAQLAEACRKGDRAAFRTLFDRYRDPMFRLAYRFTGNAEDAEDLTQEVFIRAFERIGGFRGESSLHTWLYRMAVNHCINHRRRRRDTGSLDEMEREPSDLSPQPEAICIGRERVARIEAAVSRLPEGLQAAFILVSMEGLSYAEASEVLNLSIEAVRMRMMRARRELQAALKREGVAP